MNFVSTGVQKPDIMRLLPLSSVTEAAEMAVLNARQGEAAQKVAHEKGASVAALAKEEAKLSARGQLQRTLPEEQLHDEQLMYEFMPSAKELLDELLPLTVRTTLMQCYLDATTSENVARMVAMKSATDNADKIIKSLTMQYNRARQSQITTELSEIMGGVEAMKG
jgi:ATP synthase F1 gamma subunit